MACTAKAIVLRLVTNSVTWYDYMFADVCVDISTLVIPR